MDDPTPDSTPDPTSEPTPDTPQTHAPDGWELACLGILRTAFGRRRSEALKKAMMQLSAEKAWIEGRPKASHVSWWQRIQGAFSAQPSLRFAFAAAVVLLLGALSWKFFGTGHQSNQPDQPVVLAVSGCKIADAINARWSGNAARLKTGDALPAGSLHLEAGVVELAFASGARAAVEGPAELKLAEGNAIELKQGKLAAEVPKPAIGFTVHTPNATVTDLGTRFGVNAKGADSSEVDVFEGKVQVAEGRDTKAPDNGWNLTRNMAMVLDNRGGVTTAAVPETSFPQPAHSILIRPANCGFDSPGYAKIGGLPSAFGFWSGPAFALTRATGDVRPVEGKGMLRFLAPPYQPGIPRDSVVWQLVDLRPAKDFMTANGTTDLKAWVQFNRIAGDAHSASKFSLKIAAFHGDPADVAAMWANRDQTALAFAEKELDSDNDPQTWERVDVATSLPAAADFAVMEIRAIAPSDAPAASDPFPGHFADLIDAKISLPLRASSAP